MKRLVLAMGALCFFAMACNNAPKQTEAVAADTTAVEMKQPECPMKAIKAELANWDNLADSTKTAVVAKAKAFLDEKFAKMEECKHEADSAKPCLEEKMAEMTEEAKAKMEEMKEQWANFANLTLEEQKNVIVSHLEMCQKQECEKEGEACCKNDSVVK